MASRFEPYLLDTNILLHAIRRSALWLWVERTYGFQAAGENPLVSIITEGEIRALALQFGWGEARVRRMEELLGTAVLVPLSFAGVIPAYAEICSHCRTSGTPIGENDTWIAATARATKARLLTTDRDFLFIAPSLIDCDWIDPTQRRDSPLPR